MIAMTAHARKQQVLLLRTNQQSTVVTRMAKWRTVTNKKWDFLMLPLE